MSPNEKFTLKSKFISDCLKTIVDDEVLNKMEKDPAMVVSEGLKVKSILEGKLDFFKPAFDVQRKRIHYYIRSDVLKEHW